MKVIKLLLILLVLQSCANMVIPNGGQKDMATPILKSNNLSPLNFNERTIKLTFNEYVVLNEPNKNITIQPNHTTFKTELSGKTILIKLDSILHPNTTYSLAIDNGVKDVNEGNNFNYKYIFSTGNYRDTNYIEYTIENASQIKDIKIGLNTSRIDSLESIKFEYIYNVQDNKIRVDGLNTMPYNVWIFTDKNNDQIPDKYMPIYYDTAIVNSNKKIRLNNWIKSDNNLFKQYSQFTKVYKPINDINSYLPYTDYIYIDKDSSLFFNKNFDTLPTLNLRAELENKIKAKTIGINSNKEFNIVIDKCGIRNLKIIDQLKYTEDNNYFYISSKNKIDSVRLKFNYLGDSIQLINKVPTYIESNKLSVLRIAKTLKNDTIIIVMYKDEKIQLKKKIILNNDQIFYLQPGNYKLEFYRTNSFQNLSFNFKKLRRISSPIINKEILLKPNWDEVLQLFF